MVTIPAVFRCGLISRRQRIRRKGPCGLTLGLFWFLLATAGYCQDPLQGALTMGLGDVAAIKQRAEAGDAKAQVALANALVSQFRSAEALSWYSKAAAQGNVEGQYHV